jgi:hypothetical protein
MREFDSGELSCVSGDALGDTLDRLFVRRCRRGLNQTGLELISFY